MLVGGYTKQNGNVARLAHAWAAAELGQRWFLFDPTWAAGYVNDDKFTRRFSESYYKLSAGEMIKDHMPFDPMNQLLDYPLTNKEFIEGKLNAANKKQVFHFVDTLRQYNSASKDEQVMQEMRRLRNNGIENDLINDRLKFLSRQTEAYSSQNGFEQAKDLYNQAIDIYNGYLQHKNKQFTTFKNDNELQHSLDSASYYINAAWVTLGTVVARSDANRQVLSKTYQSLNQFQNQLNKEKNFIDSYLATDKASRGRLFMRKQ